jgi:hypothetical protein
MSSSSIRILSLVGGVVLALSSVACVAAAPQEKGGNSEGGSFTVPKKGNNNGSATGQQAGSGTCDGVCSHYLECKGIADTDEVHTACVEKCVSMNVSSSDLAAVEQADCATVIAAAEPKGNTTSSSSNSGGSSSKGKECDGCLSDGSGGCYWTSQSNWGSSGYSGAVSECSAYCCE